MKPITIIVVDDHPIFRQGVVDAFALNPDFLVIAQASDGGIALDLIREQQPEVAVVDVNLPSLNGHQITRQVVAEKLPTRILLLTAYDDPEQLVHAMRAGAFAYCSKDVQPEKLVECVRQIHRGKYVLGDQILSAGDLRRWLAQQVEGAMRMYVNPGDPYDPLSEREMEVLTYVTRGMSNKEIAGLMGISHQTVKNHVTSILRKLSVEDRTQAAIFALRHGWVRLDQTNS
jgi:DNA-binding NarL/FixJ family response regulator